MYITCMNNSIRVSCRVRQKLVNLNWWFRITQVGPNRCNMFAVTSHLHRP